MSTVVNSSYLSYACLFVITPPSYHRFSLQSTKSVLISLSFVLTQFVEINQHKAVKNERGIFFLLT